LSVDPSGGTLPQDPALAPLKEGQSRGRPPLIGVTTSEVRTAQDIRPTEAGEPPRREMALGLTYMRALESAGAMPVVMPPLHPDHISPLVDSLAGIVLSGGPDLDPKTYAQVAHPKLGPTWPELDFVELAVARAADARGKPLLAICRGMQALNVARGGTLVQHVEDELGVVHRQEEPADVRTHPVRIDPDSRLAEILGTTETSVNSFHHQAIDLPGENLRPVAWAPDGVIEAVEATDREFEVGVQWHAEGLMEIPPHPALFEAFVAAAQDHAARSVS
jgi:putative glutamine amidotransferase